MAEGYEGPAVDVLEPVLNIRYGRRGNEQRPCDFEQRGTLDRLHLSPQMNIVASQIAKPASTRVRFDFHRHGFAIWRLVGRSHLVQDGVEGGAQCRTNMNLLCHV